MNAAIAEKLKRCWTDRRVRVIDGVPELRRFAGAIGVVRTVNMNGRCLVEFQGREDIGWYDIAPECLTVCEPPPTSAPTSAPTDVAAGGSRPAARKQPASTSAQSPQAVAQPVPPTGTQPASIAPLVGGSPLDLIRRRSAANARVAGSAAAAAPASATTAATGSASAAEAGPVAATPGSSVARALSAPDLSPPERDDSPLVNEPRSAGGAPGELTRADDLTRIEGIGPKIAGILNRHGIATWRRLAETDPAEIRVWLDAEGPRFRTHNPGTWPRQAALAAEGRWDELDAYQAELDGGKE